MKPSPALVLLFAAMALPPDAAAAQVDPAELAAARVLARTSGKSHDAQLAFEKIAAADPACMDAPLYLAQLALRRDDADQALAYAKQAVALAPDNAMCHHTLGDAYGRAAQKASLFSQFGLAKQCLAAYQRATALAPDNVEFHQSLFEYYRQAPGIAGGGSDQAAAEAAIIKRLDPPRGRLVFATLYTAEKKYDRALAEFDEVLQTTPDDYDALYQVGRLAAVSGQYLDRGMASLRRCLTLPPPTARSPGPAPVQWRLGQILEKKNDPAGARAAYAAAVKLDPTFAPAAAALKNLP
jgi:tetratricopeptide (TPR) repeat protein